MTLLTLAVSLLMPKLIAYVATSPRRWVNFAISYGSSILLGIMTAWAGGQFGLDFWMNATVAITTTQAAYNLYWKRKLAVQPQQ